MKTVPDQLVGRRRWIFWALPLGLIVAFALHGLEAHWQLEATYPTEKGTLEIPQLRTALRVVRDRNGVPHLRAQNPHDAWMALGFVHAQDRLGQMLWQRALAHGRSAEWIGQEGLASDQWARALDLVGLAERDWSNASRESRHVLEAYAAGVNAWLDILKQGEIAVPVGVPWEIDRIEAWTEVDSLALAKLRAWQLADVADEMLAYEAVIRRLGPFVGRAFFPSEQAPWSGGGTRAGGTAVPSPLAWVPKGPIAPLRHLGALVGPTVGSMAWVVSGALTENGTAQLAGDFHTTPRVPGTFYEAHLRSPALDLAGATIPGIPVFWAGFNGDIAWVATHAPALVMDLVEETLYSKDPSRVRRGRRWRRLEERVEFFHVRGQPDVEWVVRSTQGRPLVESLLGADRPLSLRWTGQRVGGIDGFLALTRARDEKEIRAALASHTEPLIYLAWIDRANRGGVRIAGASPAREVLSGFQPVPAGNASYAWRNWLSQDALPAETLGSSRPWAIASARLDVLERAGLEAIVRTEKQRQQVQERIQQSRSEGALALTTLVALQRDAGVPEALWLIQRALSMTRDLSHEEALIADLLQDWDGDASTESPGAAAFHVFQRHLAWSVLQLALGHPLAERMMLLPRAQPGQWLADALAWSVTGGSPDAPWTQPRVLGPLVRESLQRTWLTLSIQLGSNHSKWRWGRLNRLHFLPLWAGAWKDSQGIGPFEVYGMGSSLARVTHNWLGERSITTVSTYRFAVDAGELEQALTQLVPGQSGHPGHRHAADGVPLWLHGRPSLLSTNDLVVEDGPVQVLDLLPLASKEGATESKEQP